MNINDLAERYVAVWNESDDGRRRESITALWAKDAVMLLEPPQDIVASAAALGVTPVLEVRGHDAIEARVRRAYEEFVAPGEIVFRARDGAARLGDIVTLSWDSVSTADGEVGGGGLEVFALDGESRIKAAYQFIGR